MEPEHLLNIVNFIRANKQQPPIQFLAEAMHLRGDLGFDSFDLAELTVRLEEQFGVDVFADGLVQTVGEVLAKVPRF